MAQRTGEARTVGEALESARQSGVTSVTRQVLLAYVVGRGRTWLLAHPEASLSESEAERFAALLSRAAAGEPLAHLIGEREFHGLPFAVTPDVLIPRPETEALVDGVLEWAEKRESPPLRIVDVGTGSGAIAVTLAFRLPRSRVVAVDISPAALEIARHNARRHGVAEWVHFVLGDLLDGLAGPFDVIVANLPYVTTEELAALEAGRWEPPVALDGGPDGLSLIGRLLEQAPSRLARPGLLGLEIGYRQGERVVALCQAAFPDAEVRLEADLAGLDRIVWVQSR